MATDRNDAKSSFSSFGQNSVDLAAPGSSILSCKRGGGYVSFNGTSMATPHVAGAAALLLSANPYATVSELKEAMMNSVDALFPTLCVSGGRLNLKRSLDAIGVPWLTMIPAGGTNLPPGSATNIDVGFHAGDLDPAVYHGEVIVKCNDVTNPVVLVPVTMTILRDELSIMPNAAFTSSGYVGGPFSPTGLVFALTNTDVSSMAWSVAKTSAWLSVSSSGGVLAAGESTSVVAHLNSNASLLPGGLHIDTLSFSNANSGTVQKRDARLLIFTSPPEIAVHGTNGAVITDGDFVTSSADGTDFGDVLIAGSLLDRTYFITNSGMENLLISGVATSGAQNLDFKIMSWPALVSPGGRSNLVVRFDPSAYNARLATIIISNSDSDEAVYDFGVRGFGSTGAEEPWINEINYDSPNTDSNEFIEVAGRASTALSNYRLLLYNGSGLAIYSTTNLTGTIDDEGCGYGAVAFSYPVNGIQNGDPDGMALVKVSGVVTTLLQFLSYDGAMSVTSGPAAGQTSQNIGSQPGINPTLQLSGTGTSYFQFVWITNTMSKGSMNVPQNYTDPDGDGIPSACDSCNFTNLVFSPTNVVGSPVITSDPAGQNNVGDVFDLNQSGGYVGTRGQCGFGNFGRMYVNYDAGNLYLGAYGADMVGDNNFMAIFLGLNTLTYDATELASRSGIPLGLDFMHNLKFGQPMDIALLLGDEYGDGTYPNFNLGNGANVGQGVFYLPSGGFTAVPGAALSQFDGTTTTPTVSQDDDGNRPTDRWEVRIPWSNLNAYGAAAVTSLHVIGVFASDGLSGNNRYIAGNFMGTAASNGTQDAFNNYAFSTVTVYGVRINLPVITDSDGDAIPDFWEVANGLNPVGSNAPSANSDGDWMSDLEEYFADTSPTSGVSYFPLAQATNDAAAGTMSILVAPTSTGRLYQVRWSTNLPSSPQSWAPYGNVRTGTGAGVTFTVTNDAPARAYRTGVQLP